MREFNVTKNDEGRRADRFLSKAAPDVPPSAIQKAFRKKDVKRKDGGLNAAGTWKPCRPGERLAEGDSVRLYGFAPPLQDTHLQGGKPPRRVVPPLLGGEFVYEDAHLIVLHKPAGIPSQRDGAEAGIEDCARAYLQSKGEWLPERENGFAPSLCHRLDRNTEGLLLFAKTAEALRVLTEKIKNREITKTYRCVVEGTPSPAQGTWTDFLWKDERQKRVLVKQKRVPGAKTAVLRYRVLSSSGGRSVLEVGLVTGRTHQIRVQCASRGHPILGDGKYSKGNNPQYPHQALCAVRIEMRFLTDAGALEYLNGKVFEIEKEMTLP